MIDLDAPERMAPQFSDPYTARLVKLRNLLLKHPASTEGGAASGRAARHTAGQMGLPGAPIEPGLSPARPTYAEMMAIVNRRHPR